MAGFFGLFDYTKEGPGIEIDEPEKSAFGEFFSILGTKFWRLMVINLMMVIFGILALGISFYISNWLIPQIFPGFSIKHILEVINNSGLEFSEGVSAEAFAAHLYVNSMIVFTFLLVGLQLIVVGPFQAGFTYLFRNISRREPAFTWMDFWDTTKSNWKQATVHGFISLIVVPVMAMAFYYYGSSFQVGVLGTILKSFVGIMFIIFTIMQFYIYQLMITFRLKLKDIYKNAFLLTFLKLPSNFFVFLLNLILLYVIPMLIVWLLPSGVVTLILFLLYGFVFLAWAAYLSNFQANRQIQKYIMNGGGSDSGSKAESSEVVHDYSESQTYEDDEEYLPDAEPGEEAPEHSPA